MTSKNRFSIAIVVGIVLLTPSIWAVVSPSGSSQRSVMMDSASTHTMQGELPLIGGIQEKAQVNGLREYLTAKPDSYMNVSPPWRTGRYGGARVLSPVGPLVQLIFPFQEENRWGPARVILKSEKTAGDDDKEVTVTGDNGSKGEDSTRGGGVIPVEEGVSTMGGDNDRMAVGGSRADMDPIERWLDRRIEKALEKRQRRNANFLKIFQYRLKDPDPFPFDLEDIQKLVFKIHVQRAGKFYQGTGLVVRENLLVTNFHTFVHRYDLDPQPSSSLLYKMDMNFIKYTHVRNGEGERFRVVGVRGVDPVKDLIVLELEGYKGPSFKLADELLEDDEEFYSVGFPKGNFMTTHLRKTKDVEGSHSYQLVPMIPRPVPIVSGNSGAPVLNSKKEVIGVTNMGTPTSLRVIRGEDLERVLHETRDSVIHIENDLEWIRGQVDQLRKQAENEDVEAQETLMDLLFGKNGDEKERASLSEKAAANGSVRALFNQPSVMEWEKKGQKKGEEDELSRQRMYIEKFFSPSAEKGDATAQTIMAAWHLAQGEIQDSVSWLQRSFEDGNIYADIHMTLWVLDFLGPLASGKCISAGPPLHCFTRTVIMFAIGLFAPIISKKSESNMGPTNKLIKAMTEERKSLYEALPESLSMLRDRINEKIRDEAYKSRRLDILDNLEKVLELFQATR